MRFLIVSDIHGNREALEAVLADAQGDFDRVLCLGDIVGYGADPNFVVDWVRANVSDIVRGNHDRACSGLSPYSDFSPNAATAAEWTSDRLSPENRAFLRALPGGPLAIDDFDLVHGSPREEDEYLVDRHDVAKIRAWIHSPLSFFGHTHLQGGFELRGPRGLKHINPQRYLTIRRGHKYLVNPGSVGQPRDGDPHAAYALYSPADRVIEFRRVKYDTKKAARKIRAAGLPDFLASRLSAGR
jgi:diadenosine tetraphosphatase ApaH/serine/threonine PP2A family protein phosphatase